MLFAYDSMVLFATSLLDYWETEHKFKSQLAKCDAAGVFHFHSDIERNSITAVEQFDERCLLLLLFLLFLLLLATLPLYHLTKTLHEMPSLRYDTMWLFSSALLSYHFYNIFNQPKRKQRICIPLLSLSIQSASYLFFFSSFWHWYSQYERKNICSICMKPATTFLQKSILFFQHCKTLFILLNAMQPA